MIQAMATVLTAYRATAIVGASALIVGVLAGSAIGWRLQDGRVAKVQAAWDRQKSVDAQSALNRLRASSEASAEIGAKSVEAQVRVEARTRALKEKVVVYVPKTTPPGVIRADDRVPVGALVLLDAAARGDDPDGLSVAAGKSHEFASPVRFAELVGGYVVNLGIANQNAEQLSGLQAWVRRQQALDVD